MAYENPYITSAEIGKLPAAEGKTQTPKEQWGRAKQEFEGLLRIAIAQGREIPRGERAANFDEFVAMIDQVSNGISVVFRLAADKNPSNPQFARSLKVRGLYDPSTAANPKLFRGTIKRWESAGEDEAAS